jgi:hypothetical protein
MMSLDSLLIIAFKRGVTCLMLKSLLLTAKLSLKRSLKKFLFLLFKRSIQEAGRTSKVDVRYSP